MSVMDEVNQYQVPGVIFGVVIEPSFLFSLKGQVPEQKGPSLLLLAKATGPSCQPESLNHR